MRYALNLWLSGLLVVVGATMNQSATALQPSEPAPITTSEPLLLKGHAAEVVALAFTSDGKILASAARDERLKLWDLATGQERFTLESVMVPLDGQPPMAFSPDGKLLATLWANRRERAVKLWDVATGKELAALKQKEIGTQLTFSPNGKHLACADQMGAVTLWETATRKELGTFNKHPLGLSSYQLYSLVFSRDGRILATGGQVVTGGQVLQQPIATTHGELKLWDLTTMKEVHIQGHYHPTYSIALSPDGKFVAAATTVASHFQPTYSEVRIWDANTGRLLKTLKRQGHGNMVQEVAFSPNGETLATSWRLEVPANEKDPEISDVLLWDVATWKSRTVPRANFLAFTPDGKVVFTTDGHDVRLWGSATERKWAVLRDSKSYNGVSTLSLDGKKLAKACGLQNGRPQDPYFGPANFGPKDCTIGVWDLTKLLEQKRD